MKQLLVHSDLTATEIAVDDETRHRLRKVLRLRAGAEIVVADGRGGRRLCRWDGRALVGLQQTQRSTPPKPNIVVAAGLLKGPRWQLLLEKCTEVGADMIVPLQLEHCVVKASGKRRTEKMARWQATIDEAFEQSGRSQLPTLTEPITLGDWLRQHHARPLLYGAPLSPNAIQDTLRQDESETLAMVIGPEGGLSGREVTMLSDAQAVAIGLSTNVLRAETAAIVGTAMLANWRRTLGSSRSQ